MMQTFLQASRDNQNVQETQAILKNENQGSIIATKVIDQRKGSSSEQEHKVNALASGADEGRDKLR